MVNWKQRELERARNAVMVKERLLRELKEQVEAGHDERDEEQHRRATKRGKHGQ